jgi:cellulose synthase/poly-beta-1,6-N-acetylglucosamine synthase-like glycosyltransferase
VTFALVVSAALAAPVLGGAGYLFALTVAAKDERSPRDDAAPRIRFDIVVPAHDEEQGLGDTLAALAALDYPRSLYRIIVIADNCRDGTARVAREAGAVVLERDDPARRGKGYALRYAFDHLQQEARADAVVVIDADTTPSPGLLRAFARRFAEGAHAVQGAYGVRNPEASWRTRLMVVALALFHDLRSLGRERLGLSAGLRGNGMAFSLGVLARVPPSAYSIVEDVEYGAALARAGCRVVYAHDARVCGDMAPSGEAAATQRRRWEEGRAELARREGLALLRQGLQQRDAVLVDLALDLLLPPLSTLVLAAVAGAITSLVWYLVSGDATPLLPWIVALLLLAAHVARGLAISGAGLGGVLALLWAPAYVAWKLGLRLRRGAGREQEWIRTAREGEHGRGRLRSDP